MCLCVGWVAARVLQVNRLAAPACSLMTDRTFFSRFLPAAVEARHVHGSCCFVNEGVLLVFGVRCFFLNCGECRARAREAEEGRMSAKTVLLSREEKKRVTSMFKAADTDNSGTIDLDELQLLLK